MRCNKIRKLSIISFNIFFYILVCTLGCATIPVSKKIEPTSIIIRNNSNEYLKEVSLTENRKRDTGSIKMGSISPVPMGASQIFGRPSKPSSLPGQINVCWINKDDKKFCKLVALKSILKSSTSISGEAIVFEILPLAKISVYLEKSR